MAVCRFRARLYAVGVNRCIDVPQEVSHALGGQTHIRHHIIPAPSSRHSYTHHVIPAPSSRHSHTHYVIPA